MRYDGVDVGVWRSAEYMTVLGIGRDLWPHMKIHQPFSLSKSSSLLQLDETDHIQKQQFKRD